MNGRYISFDLEMPNNYRPRISAIGITVIDDGQIVDRIYSLVNPEVKFDPYIVKLVGITPQMVADKPTFPEIWEKISSVMSSGILVAYNAPSDLRALALCLNYYRIPWFPAVKCICTYSMGLDCYPDLERHSLDALCEHIGVDIDHHNAESDSYGSARLLLDYIEKGFDPSKYTIDFDMVSVHKCKNASVTKKISDLKLARDIPIAESVRSCLMQLVDANERIKQQNRLCYIPRSSILGVDTRGVYAVSNQIMSLNAQNEYLSQIKHKYHEENNIHAILISYIDNFFECLSHVERFLPYVNNLETCILLRPKVFGGKQPQLYPYIMKWLDSNEKYIVVFALNVLTLYYTDTQFLKKFLSFVCGMQTRLNVVNLRRADFIAAALKLDFSLAYPYVAKGHFNKYTAERLIYKTGEAAGLTETQKKRIRLVLNAEPDLEQVAQN